MPRKSRKPRVPRLLHTDTRGLGWHVTYRDADTGKPKRHRFGQMDEHKAQVLYHRWLADHLEGVPRQPKLRKGQPDFGLGGSSKDHGSQTKAVKGSLLEVASDVLRYEESRKRSDSAPRARNTISAALFKDRTKHIRDFLEYMNSVHGAGAVAALRISDLTLEDIEGFNRAVADADYSVSQVTKRMRMVKRIIDRAGRPEHGNQVLYWNWESRDITYGRPTKARELPTLPQLQTILRACELREQALIWTAIGLGFGQSDLSALRVGQIDADGYDLRRGKTNIERYGETPALVWGLLNKYLDEYPRPNGAPMFTTARGRPLVEGRKNAVTLWWGKLRARLGESPSTLGGFYTLRHLGATEVGSRPGCSIGDVRRWLGHAASSRVADVYMKPVTPEHRDLVNWVRKSLAMEDVDHWRIQMLKPLDSKIANG